MSNIKIPEGYSASDLGVSGGVAIGKPIIPGAITTLCENNEFMWGRFSGPIAGCVFEGVDNGPGGIETGYPNSPFTIKDQQAMEVGSWDWTINAPVGVAVFEDVCVWRIPADPEARPLILTMIIQPGLAGGEISYGWAGETKTVVVEAGVAVAEEQLIRRQFEVTRPDGAERTFVIAAAGPNNASGVVFGIGFHSALMTRKTYQDAGLADDAPIASGFRHARSDSFPGGGPDSRRVKSTEPVTDELLNRLVDNPRILVESTPMTLLHVSAPVLNLTSDADYTDDVHRGHAYGGAGAGSDGVVHPVATLPLFSAYRQTVKVIANWIGGADSTLRCYLSSDAMVALAPSANTRQVGSAYVGGDVTWVSDTVEIDAGVHHCKIFVDGPHSQKYYINSLQVIQVPA